MKSRIPAWRFILPLAVACLGAARPTAPSTQPAGKGAADADPLQFLQRNVEAQMQELQERMFRLAELTRETEPTDSARLLLAGTAGARGIDPRRNERGA